MKKRPKKSSLQMRSEAMKRRLNRKEIDEKVHAYLDSVLPDIEVDSPGWITALAVAKSMRNENN